ncbi:MAG: Fe-S cluster assembly protein SufD [Bacteroidota bacterium]|jgi:Fe-S cluster assembly protein SufD
MENSNKLSQFSRRFSPTEIKGLLPMADVARAFLDGNDFPTTRVERFKYTRLTKLANAQFASSNIALPSDYHKHQICSDAFAIFNVNGKVFLPDTNLPEGLHIHLISSEKSLPTSTVKDVFAGMNVLYAQSGVCVHVAKNTVIDRVIEIIHVCTDSFAGFSRNHLSIAENAQVKVLLTFVSEQTKECFSHVHTSIQVGRQAHLNVEKVQMESSDMFSFSDEEIWQEADSVFQINTLTLDGNLVRNDLHIQVQGEHAETHLNGMYMLNGQQHVANYTTVDHQVPNCESHELYKGIMDDKSVAVFNGKVFVRKDAQITNAYQSNANVLISDEASVNSKPELEIYADDVKCSHGSTTGQLDDEAIFYLRARGLSEKSAKQLMLTAFMSDVLDKITIPAVRVKVFKTINERFNWELEL